MPLFNLQSKLQATPTFAVLQAIYGKVNNKLQTLPRATLVVETLAVFVAAFFLIRYFQFLQPHIYGYDGYYHIKYSYLLRTEGFIRDFHWAQFSTWKEYFADKELLFHVLLIPFTYFSDLQDGAKYAAVSFSSGVITSFFLFLRLNSVRWRYLWMFLLLAAGNIFLFRLMYTRPHLLAIIMTIWLVHFLINRRYVWFGILTCVYMQAYTAFHMPLLLAIVVVFARWFQEQKFEGRLLFIAFSCSGGSLILSPYFPDNIATYWLQNVMLVFMRAWSNVNLSQGSELQSMSTSHFLFGHMSVLLPFATVVFLAIARPQRVKADTVAVIALSVMFLVMVASARRMLEYYIPFTLMASALYLRDRGLPNLSVLRSLRVWTCLLPSLALIIYCAVNTFVYVREDLRISKKQKYADSAVYLRDITAEGATVFTCDWDDAPELFFYNHHNRYMVFLDPLFFYAWDRDKWKTWRDLSRGLYGKETAKKIVETFNIRYGICGSEFRGMRAIIDKDPNSQILFEDKFSYVFMLDYK